MLIKKIKIVIYTMFPNLIPEYYINDIGIIYKYKRRYDVFEGTNGVRLGLGYVVKNYEKYNPPKLKIVHLKK
jgi:hypothetical protein